MATLTKGYTFGATEQVTAAKLHSLVDSATISSIVNADITNATIDLTTKVTGTLPVANGGTGLTSGTSGGILAYTASGTLASSAALTANRIVIGGGAGVVPTVLGSLGTTTTVLHGNAAGAPTFAAVSLTADVSGTLPVANGGTNLTAVGSALQVVRTNSGATALEHATLLGVNRFTSTAQTITANGSLTIAHSLGSQPTQVWVELTCTSTEANYASGDEVPYYIGGGNATQNYGLSVVPDATNLNVRFGPALGIPDKTTGAITTLDLSKWNMIFRATI